MSRKLLYWIYAGIAIFATVWLASFLSETWRVPQTGAYWHIGALLAGILAAAGWIVTSENTVRNHARGQAIFAISDYDKSDECKRSWEVIHKYFETDSEEVLPPRGTNAKYDANNGEVYDAADELLDRFEYVSMGVLNEVFDERIIKKAMIVDFEGLYETTHDYIKSVQEEEDAEVWEDFWAVCVRWGIAEEEAGRTQKADLWATWTFLTTAAIFDAVLVYVRWRL